MRISLIALALPLLAACGDDDPPPPPPPPADVAGAAAYLVNLGAPAAGVGLADGVSRTYEVAGLRRIDRDTPVAGGDLWHVGSITKSMTATLAARLVQDGRLRWESTVGEVLMPSIPLIHPGYRDVTLEQLLSHRAGTRSALTGAELQEYRARQAASPDMRAERQRFVGQMLATPPATAPGSSFTYSNIGYVTAGAMIEAATGLTWEDALRREVFAPLGLGSTGFEPPGRPGALDEPRGHEDALFGPPEPVEPGPDADNPLVLGPAGTVHISLCDLLFYTEAHGARPPGFLRADLWTDLHRLRGDEYALGWYILDEARRAHAGSNGYWYALTAFRQTDGRAIVIVTNDPGKERVTGGALALVDTLMP